MQNLEISPELNRFVQLWHIEREFFQNFSTKMIASAKELGRLNTLIYNKCKEEGVDIESLQLTPKT